MGARAGVTLFRSGCRKAVANEIWPGPRRYWPEPYKAAYGLIRGAVKGSKLCSLYGWNWDAKRATVGRGILRKAALLGRHRMITNYGLAPGGTVLGTKARDLSQVIGFPPFPVPGHKGVKIK